MRQNSTRFRASLLCAATAVAMLLAAGAYSAAEEMVAVHTTAPPEAATWTQPESKDLTLWITLALKINKEASDKFDADLQDPKSPNYHHWLPRGKAASEEYQKRFWPTPSEVNALRDWLTSQGFEIAQAGIGGLRVTGTVATAEKAFATTIVRSPGGCHANKTPAQMPARFANVVEAIRGLDNCWGGVHSRIGALTPPGSPSRALPLAASSTGGETRPPVSTVRGPAGLAPSHSNAKRPKIIGDYHYGGINGTNAFGPQDVGFLGR